MSLQTSILWNSDGETGTDHFFPYNESEKHKWNQWSGMSSSKWHKKVIFSHSIALWSKEFCKIFHYTHGSIFQWHWFPNALAWPSDLNRTEHTAFLI